MSMRPGFRKKALLLGVISGMASLPVLAQDNNEEVEEVVVTGSYLRGSPLDAPSPVQVIDRTSIEAQGAAQIWDVIKNLEVNSGSISNEGTDTGALMGSLSGTANVNLRNLGENSTLTLINGKRQVSAATTTPTGGEFVDINTIPLVMVERVEVLTDGGSALYGSDAVAGVVNVIMRTDFEGLEIYGDIQGIEKAGNLFDKTASAIWGWGSDDGNTHFVLSAETFRRDPVSVEHARYFDDRSEFNAVVGGAPSTPGAVISNPAFGAVVNPAYINHDAIAQAVAEGGTAENRYTDPLCFELNSANGDPLFWGTRTASRGEPNAACRENDYEWRLLSVGMQRDSIAGAFNHTFNDKAEFYSFFQYSKTDIERADSGAVNSRGPTVFLAAPGSHVGNPEWGGYAIGQPAELGYFAPVAGLERPTAEDIPNAPIAMSNGGINVPMYSNLYIGNTPRMGGNRNQNITETVAAQAGITGEFFAVNDRRFNYDVSYSWSGTSFESEYQTFQRDRAELAANGLGGPNCTPNGVTDFDFVSARGHVSPLLPTIWDYYGSGLTQTFFPGFVFTTRESLSLALTSNNHGQDGCQFYNPFLTSVTNPELANSQELIDWMMPTVKRADKRNKLGVIDAVLSGELVEMSGGVSQFAIGAQYRMQNNKSRAPAMNLPGLPNAILGYDENGVPNEFHYVSNNYECAQCIFNYDHDRNVKAVFAELSLPFLENIESQWALRWESYGGRIGSEVTPKVALSWRPADQWLFRGSFSQSFRAPNIGVQKEGLEASQTTFRDPISNQAVRAGMVPATNENAEPETTYSAGAPAPNVGNESANTYSAGFQWTPGGRLEGLSVGADYWRFEVKDRVMPQPGISSIAHEIDRFNELVSDPSKYVYNHTVSGNAADPYVPCDPGALEAEWGTDPENSRNEAGQVIPFSRLDCVVDPREYVVDGVVRSVGSTTASLVTIISHAINAGEVTADGVDLKASYNWNTGLGRFRVSMDYTYVNSYELSNVPGLELGLVESGIFDAAGTTGDGLLVRSLPDHKGNMTFSWGSTDARHGASAIARFIGSYQDLSYENEYLNGNDYVRSILTPKVDSYLSWDLQYSYTHEWANENLGTSTFTVGMLDAFNATLPFRYAGNLNYDAAVFDGRGRRIYARALLRF